MSISTATQADDEEPLLYASSNLIRFFDRAYQTEKICDETVFHGKLHREGQRTDRSGRPFLLMLIDLEFLLKKDRKKSGKEFESVQKKLIKGLPSLIRETDIAGWFVRSAVIGVIYTEIDAENQSEIREKLLSRIRERLTDLIGPELAGAVPLSAYFYPMDFNPEKESDLQRRFASDSRQKNRSKSLSRWFKRLFDITGSLCGLLLFSPFFLILPLLIKRTSPGPVFFRQERLGLNGKPFVFLKFRSMTADNDVTIHREYIKVLIEQNGAAELSIVEGGEQVFKIQNDPRVTPIGHFLRKTSLDEIPQFINVLKGEMSLIGPRPPIPYELEHYQFWHRHRIMEVKPGITGLWQVKGRSSCNFDEMVRLDLQYIREWSLWLDLKIFFLTPWVMIAGRGGY